MSTVTSGTCNHPHCYPDTGCALGERLHDCSHFTSIEDEKGISIAGRVDGEGIPWAGSAFGVDDIAWLASQHRPLLYAPIGAHNAGKTTFLASLYIGLCRGLLPGEHQFIGSFTLGGWEKLAAYVRHAPAGVGPRFPPHTPVTQNRMPGFLHFGVRTSSGEVRDILFPDAPGEWFSRWAVHPDGDGTDGARWIVWHSDGFLFFVDSEGLVGSDRRNVAEKTELLARRLAEVRGERPVAIVWAKSDKEIQPTLRKDLEAALVNAFPDVVAFQTSVYAPPANTEPTRQFWNVIEWFLRREQSFSPLRVINTVAPNDAFLAYRG